MDDELVQSLLPRGWQAEDGLLVCPHGEAIEHDGTCPQGCVSPLLRMGLI